MAELSELHPTLLDLARRQDPDGTIADIVELLTETNEILDDMVWMEGNLPTGHRTTVRTGLPTATWRKLYGGIASQKSTTAQITDNTGMLEMLAVVDEVLANLSGNVAGFRLSEESAFREALMQEMAQTIFFGNEGTEPEAFTGLMPRYNSLSAENAENIINAGGDEDTDIHSIWLVFWGSESVFGITPKGSTAGLEVRDMGVDLENAPEGTGQFRAYRTHYRWHAGLTVRDWRQAVRICNIDQSELTADAGTGANLPRLMTSALNRIKFPGRGRPAFYMSRAMREAYSLQKAYAVRQSTLTMEDVGGRLSFRHDGVPIRICDALDNDETVVT